MDGTKFTTSLKVIIYLWSIKLSLILLEVYGFNVLFFIKTFIKQKAKISKKKESQTIKFCEYNYNF